VKRLDVPTFARAYDVPLVDYCEGDDAPDRWGLLIGSGCGLMMSVMDHVPFRYCVDADTLRLHLPSRAYALAQLTAAAGRLEGVALVGWFSISDPEPLRAAFAELNPPGLVYAGATRLRVPGEVETLQQFLDAARKRWSPFTGPDHGA
jgi:hypothetical protein